MKYKEIEKRLHPRFSGVKTFFRCPQYQQGNQPDALIFGVPFDGGTTYRSGARMAPSRVRDISALGRGYDLQKSQDVFKKLNIYDGGDIPVNPISLLKTYQSIEDYMSTIWKQELKMLFVGGDHSITLPLLRACSKVHGPLNLIHFDAHYDTYPPAYGEDYHHGTFVRHAVTEKLVQKVWQFGVRGPLTHGQDKDFVDNNNIKVFYVDDIKEKGRQILSQLPKVIQGPTYLSFDVDCLDPAFAPGTGTPMVGGLSSYEAKNLLKNLQIEQLVAADVVEVNPSYDHGDITSLVAADVLLECMHLMI